MGGHGSSEAERGQWLHGVLSSFYQVRVVSLDETKLAMVVFLLLPEQGGGMVNSGHGDRSGCDV